LLDKPGGIFVRRGEQTSEEDRTLLQTVARIVLHDSDGTFREQVDKRMRAEVVMPALRPRVRRSLHADTVAAPGAKELSHFNGTGGFSADGREYVMVLDKNRTTPAPWVNVLANPTFGSLISESGGAYTWLENCHEYRLTPWSNDPVSDTTGEALYIRDEDSGAYWSPQPMPARGPSSYIVRHGFGYTTFETSVDSIASELQVYVAMDAPMKFMRLKLTNRTGSRRNLSVWGYFEWVLGDLRARSLMHVHTDVDARSGAILARNPYSADFSTRIAFVSSTMRPGSFTGDRMEFIGRNGSLKNPQALGRLRLSNKVGPGLDPCAGLQLFVSLAPGESREVVLELGIGQDIFDVQNLLGRFGHLGGAKSALDATQDFWKETLSEVSVETPDSKVDLLANGWLLYQTLACRMWARTGFYQSGGAFGFRDQLQDSLALLHSHPALTRQHLLTCAQHQFRQGDVQHWWHVPSGRGVRTHISDDYLWLPFVACQYARGTGDAAIFDEVQPYVDGRPVNADEESYYDMPLKSEESGTLYEHCVRAIEHGLRFGEHGLPLMGCGDWNDGMNRVGAKGKGESVWLAFFLYDVLTQFERVARNRGDAAFADRCKNQAQMLQQNIEAHAWDGDWYRRAYFDDGRPLGSATSPECQIDSLPQSWSVISAAGDVERSRRALEEVNARLVKRGEKLIQLFDPPFNKSDLDPGYIKGYLPGVRENGGQYTHAALWAIMAFAKQGRHQTAWELLSMLNPINHSLTPKETEQYKVEPYVVAADVYGVAPHVGRGGWTWYTGSAGWMYRVIVESLLGLRVENDVISLKPCIPSEWNTFKIHYRFWDTQYEFQIERDDSVTDTVFIENGKESRASLRLVNSGVKHAVRVCFNANDHDTSLVANTALARGANPA
jgi:cellobiose phosphorylase